MIERVAIIYKHIIRMGPELNFERFRAKLLERKFRESERIIPTPEGPLKEYVMTEPKYLRDVIVVSRKGFVVDSKDLNYALELIALAYDIYENMMRDYVEYVQVDITGIYELIYIMKAAENLPGRIIKDSILNKINVHLGQDVRPLGVAFYRGIPAAPHEFIVVNVSPVLVPFQESSRLKIDITYRGTDSEKAINFIKDMPIFAKKLVEALSA